jgi:myosin-light-chain kinase
VIDDDFVLTERACAIFMRQICEGVEFIHKQNILHLDMKVSKEKQKYLAKGAAK